MLNQDPNPFHAPQETPGIVTDLGDEMPTEASVVRFELIPVPTAQEPHVAYMPEVEHLRGRLKVDTETMTTYLKGIGWSALNASSIHITFASKAEYRKKYKTHQYAIAHHSHVMLPRPGSNDPEDLLSYLHGIVLSIGNRTTTWQLNRTLRHELGHGDCNGRFGASRLYGHLEASDTAVALRERGMLAPPPKKFGISARTIGKAVRALGMSDYMVLHALDKEERYANRFARKHSDLNVISYS